jgi:hypothetical protein
MARSDEQYRVREICDFLAGCEQLRTTLGEDVAQMGINLCLRETDRFGTETVTRIRKTIGSDYVVLGSYLALGKRR